jgi:hypothetical protein
MPRRGKFAVNTIVAIFILAWLFIFTALFVGGGKALVKQNFSHEITNALKNALNPFRDPCTCPPADAVTDNETQLVIQAPANSRRDPEPWGV